MQTTAIRTVANSLPENEVILLTLLISKRYIPYTDLLKNIVTSPLDASVMLHRHIDEIKIYNGEYLREEKDTLTTYQANITFSK